MDDASPERSGSQPPLLYPPYKSTVLRAPAQPLIRFPPASRISRRRVYGYLPIGESRHRPHAAARRRAAGRADHRRPAASLDEDGRPVPHALVEIWQANAAGRYRHAQDNHPAPLDPNFSGAGRTMTDAEGRYGS